MNVLYKYKFTGKERDKESGLDYFGARYYDSEIGRWLSVDPLGSQRPGLSPYQYCQNNPLALIDHTGMLDDWYENEDHEVVYDKDVHSQDDLDKKGIKGTYEGTEGYVVDSKTNQVVIRYNADGTISRTENVIDPYMSSDDGRSNLSKANMIVSAASTEKNIINGIVKELPEAQATKYFRFSRIAGWGLTGVSIGMSALDIIQNNGSPNSIARGIGNVIITGSAFIPYVGIPISIGLSVADYEGCFDPIYNYFRK